MSENSIHLTTLPEFVHSELIRTELLLNRAQNRDETVDSLMAERPDQMAGATPSLALRHVPDALDFVPPPAFTKAVGSVCLAANDTDRSIGFYEHKLEMLSRWQSEFPDLDPYKAGATYEVKDQNGDVLAKYISLGGRRRVLITSSTVEASVLRRIQIENDVREDADNAISDDENYGTVAAIKPKMSIGTLARGLMEKITSYMPDTSNEDPGEPFRRQADVITEQQQELTELKKNGQLPRSNSKRSERLRRPLPRGRLAILGRGLISMFTVAHTPDPGERLRIDPYQNTLSEKST